MKRVVQILGGIFLLAVFGTIVSGALQRYQDKSETTLNESQQASIVITSPNPDEQVSLPFRIEGEARGTWFFEGDFPFVILDENGTSIHSSFVSATADSMTEEFVPFFAEVTNLDWGNSQEGTILFLQANPADSPHHGEQEAWPILFPENE